MNHFNPRLLLLAVVSYVLFAVAQFGHAQQRQPFITRPQFDSNAPEVELFAGVAGKQLGVAIIPTNERVGNVLIENVTEETITVRLPDSFVGQQVPNRVNPNAQRAQPVGGGFLGGPLRDGRLSIPSKRIAQVQYRSVCLAHGWPDPRPDLPYEIMPVENFTQDKILQTLIYAIGTERINQKVSQAAAWHVANKMPWERLATELSPVAGLPVPFFNQAELVAAHQLVVLADKKSKEEPQPAASVSDPTPDPKPETKPLPRQPIRKR